MNRLPAKLFATILCGFAVFAHVETASAAVQVQPSHPVQGQAVSVWSDDPGVLRWGVNGWRQPAKGDWPQASKLVNKVIETRLQAAQGRYVARFPEFKNGSVQELNFVLRLDSGSWLNNGGQDFRVFFQKQQPKPRITIGPGRALGQAMGQAHFEEFQDWTHSDLRRLDRMGDARQRYDGQQNSRDLVAFYTRREHDALFMRTDFYDLALGAEQGQLSLVVLIDFKAGGQAWLPEFLRGQSKHPWELALVIDDSHSFRVFDQRWQRRCDPKTRAHLYKGCYIRSDLDAAEFGLSLELLREQGWSGQELKFQVLSFKPGDNEVMDAVAETNIYDRELNESISERQQAGSAKYSVILHGNQAVKRASEIHELIRNPHIHTPSGHETGYFRALETHQMFDAEVNIHVSGTLASSFAWATHPDAGFSGPAFNAWIAHLVRSRKAALMGGVLAEHIIPYFEKSGVNEVAARLKDQTLRSVYGTITPRVYWTPERVIRAACFDDIKSSGYQWTVIDQANHIWKWYGKAEAQSKAGHKIQRINGVNCFLINDDADQKKFWNTDGGAHLDTRRMLLEKALDGDQQQLTLVFDDWEAYAGRSFTSFGVGNDNPDNYHRHVRWLANHPWIQMVTLDEVASWRWSPVDRGQRSDLGLSTYHWLNHATEDSYDTWYYGSNAEESFAAYKPLIRNGQRTPKAFGDVWTAGTLMHDCWRDVQNAPAGPLKELAEATFCTAIFETAWHDEDQHNYHDRDAQGRYIYPDTSYDYISGWSLGMQNKIRDASIVASAARWAHSNPGSKTQARRVDVDQDSEEELVLSNNRLYAVFENDGGRLIMAFARDTKSGLAYCVLGAPVVDPGAHKESEYESDFRASGLKDVWAENGGLRYVNGHYQGTLNSDGVRFVSADGKIRKSIRLRAGSDRLEVSYDFDDSVGQLYVRTGLNPGVMALFMNGLSHSQFHHDSGRFGLETTIGKTQLLAMMEASGINNTPQDGGLGHGRNAALTQQLELSGRRSLSFTLILSAWQ